MSRLLSFFVVPVLISGFSISAFAYAPPPPLSGVWNSPCYGSNDFYHVLTVEIHEDVWTTTDWSFSDADCTKIVLEFQTMHQVDLNGNELDAKTLMSYLRPYTNELAAEYNGVKLCGRENWKRGRRIEVTGSHCDGFDVPAAEQRLYSTYAVEGPRNNILWIGEGDLEHDGSSPDRRHQRYFLFALIRDPKS